jgi:hypothetical protein
MVSTDGPTCPYCAKAIRPGTPVVLRADGIFHIRCSVALSAEAAELGARLARELEEVQGALARLQGGLGEDGPVAEPATPPTCGRCLDPIAPGDDVMVRDGSLRHLRCPTIGRKPPARAEPPPETLPLDPRSRPPEERGQALA